jgi:hypothetical protein
MSKRVGVNVVALMGAGAVLMGACAPGDHPEIPTQVVSECEAAFSDLVSARAGDPNIPLDEALEHSLRICGSSNQWLRMASNYPAALPAGASAEKTLADACSDPRFERTGVCMDHERTGSR